MARKDRAVDLQMALIVDEHEIILRIFDDGAAMLTVRSMAKEEKAEVELTFTQAQVLVDMLQRIPGDGDPDGDD